MSTGPPRTRREPVLATIVQLPLRAIERSRGRRRVVLLVIEVPVGPAVQPATVDNNALAARISWIGTAGLFKAGRLRAEGDPAGAWSLLNAIIRASPHIDWVVPTANGRSHGIMLAQYARSSPKRRATPPLRQPKPSGAIAQHQAILPIATRPSRCPDALASPLSV